jgi:hypothetical protein
MAAPHVWSREKIEEFGKDWLGGMPAVEMATKYGFKAQPGVSQKASRLGLPARIGKRNARYALQGGSWETVNGIQRWVPEERKQA